MGNTALFYEIPDTLKRNCGPLALGDLKNKKRERKEAKASSLRLSAVTFSGRR